MPINNLRKALRSDLESDAELRQFGTGWLSGIIALICSVASLSIALCIQFPALFTIPQLHELYESIPYRTILYVLICLSYSFAILNLFLRRNKIIGSTALVVVLLATAIFQVSSLSGPTETRMFFGLDWFIINIIFTGLLFVPLERLFPQREGQSLFRIEWREDLFYYFVSSMLVQIFTMASLWPSMQIASHTSWPVLRAAIGSQPFILQLLEIMLLTDLVQYWTHRAFHRIPFLWKFHSVHHSARAMDWMAGARMHFIEIVVLRGLTVIPMQILGFGTAVIQTYIFIVYVYSTLIHSNVRLPLPWLARLMVTPRFHHWHHGIEREAIDVNFAIHFPLYDKLFGTYYMPEDKWPEGYGIKNHPVPLGYIKQFFYPFKR